MKALDLFCGLGGWSDGLVAEGFEVLGVEIEPTIASLYNHPVLVEDVRKLSGKQFPDYDLIVGSPPCRDFTQIPSKKVWKGKYVEWKDPKNPERGLELVNAFLRIVKEAQPTFWLLENVRGLRIYMGPPKVETHLGYSETSGSPIMNRCFWGNFPSFLISRQTTTPKHLVSSKIQRWKRAKIPFPIAQGLGKSVKNTLLSHIPNTTEPQS